MPFSIFAESELIAIQRAMDMDLPELQSNSVLRQAMEEVEANNATQDGVAYVRSILSSLQTAITKRDELQASGVGELKKTEVNSEYVLEYFASGSKVGGSELAINRSISEQRKRLRKALGIRRNNGIPFVWPSGRANRTIRGIDGLTSNF